MGIHSFMMKETSANGKTGFNTLKEVMKMRIYFYDGSSMFCTKIEISMYKDRLIVDEYKTFPIEKIIKIVD